jgi:tetratricopeptide (TPR) repeat protein
VLKRLKDAQDLSRRLEQFERDVLGASSASSTTAAAAASSSSSAAAGSSSRPGSRPGTAGSARPSSSAAGAPPGASDPAVALAPLPPGPEAARLQSEVDHLTREVAFCGRVQAARAWLLLRGGALDALAACPLSRAPDAPREAGESPDAKSAVTGDDGFDWEWWVMAQVHYHKGDLPAAAAQLRRGADALSRRHQAAPSASGLEALLSPLVPSDSAELAGLAESLDHACALKDAGNAALKKGDSEAAASKYSEALTRGLPPGFAAVLYCNRAAAHQAASRWTEALADCGRAAALSPGYAKAHSRMAALLLEVRRPATAAAVLEALLAGVAPGAGGAWSPAEGKRGGGANGGSAVQLDAASRRAYEERLGAAKRAARWAKTPHFYRLLGLEKGAGDDDVKK